jgi:PAS domain S-box-containing protein
MIEPSGFPSETSQRERAGNELPRQAEGSLAGENRLLEIIGASGPLTGTLAALCRLAEDVLRGSVSSILLLDRKGERIRTAVGPSLPVGYMAALDGHPVDPKFGPCGAAARFGNQVICRDIKGDERWASEYRALALAHGLRACCYTPIKSWEGRVLGAFAIYQNEPSSPTPEQRNMIEQLTRAAGIAIERAESINVLRRSEERYALAMEAASDGHTDWNLVTGEFYVSPRLLRITGHSPDATFVDRADWVRRFPFHPEDRARWEAAIATHFAGREAKFNGDFRIVVNGETRWLAFNFIAMRDATGNVIRWTGSIADINDGKRDIATVLDAIPGLVAILTPVGEVDAVNNELVAYCGQPLEAMKQWGTNGTVHPEDLPRVAAIFGSSISAGEPYDFEARIRRFDGVYRWNQVRGLPFRDARGQIVRWCVLLSDIDFSKRAEEALRLSEKRYERAMLAAEAGFWDWDVPADEFYISPKLLEMTDFPAGTRFAGRADFMARAPFYPDDWAKWESAVKELFASGGTRLAMEIRSIHAGETRWALLSGICVRDEMGKILRWTGSATDVTARKRVEEALRESEQRYERAMLASDAGFWDWDVATDKYYVSPKLLEKIGFPSETEFVGRADFSARGPWHPGDLANWERAVNELFASDRTRLTGEMRTIHGAETRWYRLSGMCMRDSAGKVRRWTGSATDITEEKRAQEALHLSEERYALAMEASEEGHFDRDLQTDEIFVSEHLKQMLDLPMEVQHRTYSDMVAQIPFYPGDRERVKEMTRNVLAGAAVQHEFEYRLLRGESQELHWIRARWKIFRDAQGVAQRIIGVVSDITERKRAEDEVRSRQEMLEVAQKAARAAAFEWRGGGGKGANRWSPDMEAMHGIPAGSYDGTYDSWKKLVHAEDWPNVEAALKTAGQTGELDAEYRVIHRDGAIHWLQAKGRMLFDPEGKPTRVVGFMLDVTDRHVAEEELRRIERQLRQAQRLEALGTLAGGIAHDFNNLLGVILGYGEMALRKVRAGSGLRRDIDKIMIAGERANALVERILAFSRSGIGERVAVHVEKIVRETLALFAAKLPRGIVVEQRLRAGRAAVMGDPTQIHQVLMNLLANAVQAMPTGGKVRVSVDRIRIEAPRLATSGPLTAREYVVIEVWDSGSGIPAEIVERIFDPFFTTKEVGVGTGLGLSLVHGIVTGLGGAIDVATIVGRGSGFKVYLALAGGVAALSEPRKRVETRTHRAGRGRVLIVDDEEALVKLVTETLTELGYSSVGFTAGAKALQAFLENPNQFDAVITDECMPGMSGAELIGEMRTLRPDLPILLVSGYLSAPVIERAKQAGATELLKKPLRARQLQIALTRMLPPKSGPRKSELTSSKVSGPADKRRRVGPSRTRAGPERR